MADNRELLTEIYAAFNARRIDDVLAMMHQNVDWPNGMEGGRVHGHAGVRDYWTRQWAMIDPHVDPVGFDSSEPGVTVVSVHQVVKGMDGTLLQDRMVEHVYRFENGLILSMEIRD